MDSSGEPIPSLCRECFAAAAVSGRCRDCGSPRMLRHPELFDLAIAHLDCDAFYAAIEKRDDPSLRDKPVIIGGGQRGVVSTACYTARIRGVKSAMPMFKALKLCPDATVLRPNMEKYVAIGREVRALMRDLTPLVEPLSIDEAFMDLTGTQRLLGHCPAAALARLATTIEKRIGITVSIGLSHNKFLAKLASDLDKPRGFSIIGRAETQAFLARQPVSAIWGVGKQTQAALARHGITRIVQLQGIEQTELMRLFGSIGLRLYRLSRGEDARTVDIRGETKSISAETTFNDDLDGRDELEAVLWRLAEKVSRRAKVAHLAGQTVTLKLKTARFRILTRSETLTDPTNLASRIHATAAPLLAKEADGTAYRLIGVGLSHLVALDEDPALHMLDPRASRAAHAEVAMDKVREKFGLDAVRKGRAIGTSGRQPRR